MKNKLLIATIGLILILSTVYSKADEFKNFQVETKGIKVEINTKLELFHIMAYLGNSTYLNNFDFKYKSDIDTFFASYKNDNSVQFVNQVLQNYHANLLINGLFFNKDFKKDTSVVRFLHLENLGLPNTLINKSLILDSLNQAVESFAKTSHFVTFVKSHNEYYQKKVDEAASEISKLEIINDFETFWGVKKDNYTIVITLLEQGIHSYWFTRNDKSNSVFFLSPKFVLDNDARFGNSEITNPREGKMAAKDYIYYGATHEFGHTFLNPIMDNYVKQIEPIAFKFSTSDPTKLDFLCESFLRSLTAYFLIKNKYDEFAQMVLQGEKQQGYIYNEIIVELIKDYEGNRNNYKNINDYIPVFLDRLKLKIENN